MTNKKITLRPCDYKRDEEGITFRPETWATYKVMETTNTLRPRVGEVLPAREVELLLSDKQHNIKILPQNAASKA